MEMAIMYMLMVFFKRLSMGNLIDYVYTLRRLYIV